MVCRSGLPYHWTETYPEFVFSEFCPHSPGPHTLQAGASGATQQDYDGPLEGNCAHSIGHNPTDWRILKGP